MARRVAIPVNLVTSLLLLMRLGSHIAAGASLVPGFFIFGDSTMDTGNNNFLNSSQTRADNPPYGRDFVPPGPNGRFSNGKLVDDFIAEFLGVPYPIDFYNPQAKDQMLRQGVNFASAGSGLLDQTGNSSGSVSFSQQLQNFALVRQNVLQLMGPASESNLISGSIFLISSGGNDLIDYQISLKQRIQLDEEQFNALLVSKLTNYIQALYTMGARKIAISLSGPLGCLPVALTVFLSLDGSCIKEINSQVQNFNAQLQSSLSNLSSQLSGLKLVVANTYDVVLTAIQNPTSHGFKYGHKACCGNGIYGGASKCTPSVSVCTNASEHVFWDLVHPTQAMYKILADALISGPPTAASPNLRSLIRM